MLVPASVWRPVRSGQPFVQQPPERTPRRATSLRRLTIPQAKALVSMVFTPQSRNASAVSFKQ